MIFVLNVDVWCHQSMTEQQVILQRQEREQQDKVRVSVPDKKRLTELENHVAQLKKGKKHYTLLHILLCIFSKRHIALLLTLHFRLSVCLSLQL